MVEESSSRVKCILYIHFYQESEIIIGTEKDVISLKQHGNPGEFVVYETNNSKIARNDSGYRVAFLWYDEKTQYQSLKKVRILKTETGNKGKQGFCMEHEPNKLFDSVDNLIYGGRNDPDSGMAKPFDVSRTQLGRVVSSPSLNREGSQSSPDIRGQGNHFQPKPVITGLSPNLADSRATSRSLTGLNVQNTDHIHYNQADVRKLLFGKPLGTYVIHKGEEDTEHKPYDIYVNDKSMTHPGTNKIKKMYVYHKDGSYLLGNDQSLKYKSLNELVSRNRSTFIHPIENNSERSKPYEHHIRPPVDPKVEYIDFHNRKKR